MKKLFIAFSLAAGIACHAQLDPKIDTTNWKQCVVQKIKPVMVPGGRAWKVTFTHGPETGYRYCNEYPCDLKRYDCIVIGKDIWNELLKNK